MRRTAIMLGALTGLLPVVSGAQRVETRTKPPTALPVWEFRGHQLGEPAPPPSSECFASADEPGTLTCTYLDVPLGPARTAQLFQYYAGQLMAVTLMFDSDRFLDVAELYRAKYGRPDSATVQDVTSGAGVAHKNIVQTWRFSRGSLVLQRYATTIRKGAARIADTVLEAAADSAKKEARARQAKRDM